MNKSKNTGVSKAQALGLVTYLTYNTDYHFSLDVSTDRCDVSIFVHTGAELFSLQIDRRTCSGNVCTMSTTELTEAECWSYNIEYPCVWSFAK